MRLTLQTIMGATISHPLQRIGETIPSPLATDWPYLSACCAFAVPAAAASVTGVAKLVRAQLAVAAFDKHGQVLEVTGVQVAKVSAMGLRSWTTVCLSNALLKGTDMFVSRYIFESFFALRPPLTVTHRNTGPRCRVPVLGTSWRSF